ncbi:MAG: prephenate dehydrogenase [Candidatus Firestonebacteria bacterium]|nr:prephenate dehydrogenase [Candidatus Firestonebacteria bacterium]
MVRERNPSRLFSKVTIVGVGLMGGSLGLAIKKRGLAKEVVGLVRRRQTLVRAKALGAIDAGTLSLPQAVRGAELVIVATPVNQLGNMLRDLAPHLPAGCLVTDVGSTKVRFLRDVEKMFYVPDLVTKTVPVKPTFTFVSSHPMAGSEKEGVEHARKDLYESSHCLLIRTKYTPADAIARLETFWRSVGCRLVSVVTPEEHDHWVAAVSHLPHALAACLVNVVQDLAQHDPRLVTAAGPGFRDTTRVAAGAPALWTEILLSNREEVCGMIQLLRQQLSRMETALQSNEPRRLSAQLEQASSFRQELEKKRRVRKVH